MPEQTNWYFPVVGPTEYSGGSWMPKALTHRGRTHAAIDIYAAAGQPIVAPVSGTVTMVRSSDIGGNTLQLKGDDGITYYFAHMGEPSQMQKGQRIQMGTMFGIVGNSGSAKNTSPHLHFSMRRGRNPANPIKWLDAGYRMPQFAADASLGAPQPYDQSYASPGSVQYVDPFTVVENAIAESDPVVPNNELTPESFLSSAMSQMANLISGGVRKDYKNIGVRNVPRSLIQANEAVDEGARNGAQEG